MESGYIYILNNQYITGLLKIGFTTRDPQDRVRELSSHTGVPGKFNLVYAWEVENPSYVEKVVFSTLKKYRAEGEFFSITSDEAKSKIIEILQRLGQVDESGITISQKARDILRNQEEEKIREQQSRIKNCQESWRNNINITRAQAIKIANSKIGYSYDQINTEIKKCAAPEAISTPATLLTLGLSLILEAKWEKFKGKQKWVDLQNNWLIAFENEMIIKKDSWWDDKDCKRPSKPGYMDWSAFYMDVKY